ncbi:hypothetical protein [Gemmobacter nanjingensis]|uniref:hypothetical protein n=1 Tax=Gemmobacter nanjingensis TaxID=488454 RepID=UPI00188D857B|nr:hypothetical protein [Gemmobacter nanjingensis]
MMHSLSALIAARMRLFRASFILFALGLMLATANACPTGQTDCDMDDMASGIESSEVCMLACGVPLPIEVMVAPELIGTVAALPKPDHSTGIGLLPEPDFRPPRTLA